MIGWDHFLKFGTKVILPLAIPKKNFKIQLSKNAKKSAKINTDAMS